jgi:putative transposase
VLLAFYDVAAEHWKHLRTTNPIESALQPCRRPVEGLPVDHHPARHDLQVSRSRPKLILAVKFTDGLEVVAKRGNL